MTESIKVAIDTADGAKNVRDLRKSIKDLQNQMLSVKEGSREFTDLSSAVGRARDRMDDLKDSTQSLQGTGIERLSTSFNLMKDAFMNFDFDKLKIGFTGLKTAVGAVIPFVIVELIMKLIENFDALAESGGILGSVFKVIKIYVDTVIGALKSLGDWLGLTDSKAAASAEAQKKAAEKYAEAYKKADEDIRKSREKLNDALRSSQENLLEDSRKTDKKMADDRLAAITKEQSDIINSSEGNFNIIKRAKENIKVAEEIHRNELLAIDKKWNKVDADNKKTAEEEKAKKEEEYRNAEKEERKRIDEDRKRIDDEAKKAEVERQAQIDADEKKKRDDKEAAKLLREKFYADEFLKENATNFEVLRQTALDQQNAILNDENATQTQRIQAQINYSNTVKKIDQDELNFKRAKQAAEFGIANDTLKLVSNLGNLLIKDTLKQEKFNKAAALTKIGIDTAQALSSALTTANAPTADNILSGGIAGIAKYITLAGVITANALKAKQVLSGSGQTIAPAEPPPTLAPSGGGIGGGGGTTPAAPANVFTPTQFFGLGGQSTFRTSGGGEGMGQRVYVLENDITKTQGKVSVIEGRSKIK